MTTLAEILAIPRYSDIQLLTPTHHPRLHQSLQSIDISETPDMAQHISKNALVLTTAMTYSHNQAHLKGLINSLIEVDALGLGIKPGRFLNKIDPDVIDHAARAGLPLIEIPDNYQLGTVLHQFLNIIWDTHFEEINFALDIQKQLSDMFFQNASNEAFVGALSQTLQQPTILLDPFFEVIASSNHFNRSTNRADYYSQQIFHLRKTNHKAEGTFSIKDNNNQTINAMLMLVRVYQQFPYYLLLLHPEQMLYPLSNFALDQASFVLSYALFKNDHVERSKYNIESQQFKEALELLSQNNDSFNYSSRSLHLKHIKKSTYYCLIHVYDRQLDYSPTSLSPQADERLAVIYRWLRGHVRDYFPQALVYQFQPSGEIYLLLQEAPKQLDQSLKKMAGDLKTVTDISLIFSVGNSYSSLQELNQSYTQATLTFQERLKGSLVESELIKHYENKGIHHLFNQIEDSKVEYFCHSILKDLAQPEDSGLLELRKTLQIYLDNQGEIASTAQELFVHRNTVKYRIQRCEEILGQSVTDPEFSLNLRLALSLTDQSYH